MIATTSESDRRDLSDLLLLRCAWLDEADRELIEQVVGRGVRPSSIAAVTGVTPRAVQRRVTKLVDRLTDAEVLMVLRQHGRWPATTSSVALAVWVRGRTLRQVADELGLTLHEVRQHVQRTRGLLAALGDSPS